VVWPPLADRVDVCLGGIGPDRSIPLEPGPRGYHAATVENVAAGTTYRFKPNGGYAFVLLGPGERPE
jgi:1,4-alpha-glucan branching enzyme